MIPPGRCFGQLSPLTILLRTVSDAKSACVCGRRLRALVLSWAVSVRLPEAVARARTLFNDWKNAGLRVPPDLRQLVYATG